MHIILSNAIHARQYNANHHNIWGEGKQDRGKQGSKKLFWVRVGNKYYIFASEISLLMKRKKCFARRCQKWTNFYKATSKI